MLMKFVHLLVVHVRWKLVRTGNLLTECMLVANWIRENDLLLHFVDHRARDWTTTRSKGLI